MSRLAVSDDRHQPGSPSGANSPSCGPPTGGAGRRQLAEHERPEAVRVAHADDPLLVEDDQAERATDAGQDLAQGLDRVLRRLVGEQRGEQLGVGRGGQAGSAALQLARAARAC